LLVSGVPKFQNDEDGEDGGGERGRGKVILAIECVSLDAVYH
jgi:hypothetical protein